MNLHSASAANTSPRDGLWQRRRTPPPALNGDRPLAIDLFSGAGGIESAGFDVVASVEVEPIHAAVHEFNFAYGTTLCADAATVSGSLIRERAGIGEREVALVAGGPPCQGISLMGRRAIDDPRNALLREFVRLVLEIGPRYAIMENVAGLAVGEHARLLDEVADDLEAGGYRVRRPIQVLQAAEFGTPQSRRRLFVLASRHDVPMADYPATTHRARAINGSTLALDDGDAALPWCPSVADALGDLPNASDFPELASRDVVDSLLAYGDGSPYARALRRPADPQFFARPRPYEAGRLTSSMTTAHGLESVRRFAATTPGTNERISRFLRLHPNGIANTLRAGTGSERGGHTAARPIHPEHPRVITVREAARLHGYPDWFRFAPTKWSGFREVGNSVPIPLGRTVAGAVLHADGITPTSGSPTPLGDAGLLGMSARQAREALAS